MQASLLYLRLGNLILGCVQVTITCENFAHKSIWHVLGCQCKPISYAHALFRRCVFLLAGVNPVSWEGFFFILSNELFKIFFFLILTLYISVQFRLQVGEEIQSHSAFENLRWHFSKHQLGEKILLLFVLLQVCCSSIKVFLMQAST